MMNRARQWRTGLTCAAAFAVLGAAGSAAAEEPTLSVDLGKGVHIELVLIRPGTFTQGSPDAERGRSPDEAPRQVTLSRGFYIGKYPVTRGQFARFADDSGYRTESETGTSGGYGWDGNALVQKPGYTWKTPGFAQTDDHPVVLVTYGDAQAFAEWLSKASGRTADLPTEAQMEYAERAGSKTRYYGGDGDDVAGRIGWFKDNAGQGTKPVGQKQANEWGLYDMAGNAWQWCRDYYGPYEAGPVTDPLVTSSPASEDKPRRVLRGGSWLKDGKNLRSAARYRNAPGSRNADNGFRVVASVTSNGPAVVPTGPSKGGSGAPAEPSGSGSDGAGAVVGGLCLGGGVFGVVLALIVIALRRSSNKALGNSPSGVSYQPAADGFWILASPGDRGRRVSYQAQGAAGVRQGTVVLDGGPRQFVYTGSAPAHVALVLLDAPPRWQQPSRQRSSSFQQEEDRTTFRGYPSAY